MSKKLVLGQVREFLNLLGAALLMWGFGSQELWAAGVGAVMSVLSLVWVVRAKATGEVAMSAVRKFIGAVAGFIIAGGWMEANQVGSVVGVLMALVPLVWSLFANAKGPSGGGLTGPLPMWLLLGALLCLLLPSCAVESYTVDGSGLDWSQDPVQVLEPERVTPNVRLTAPERLGGGSVMVPVVLGHK